MIILSYKKHLQEAVFTIKVIKHLEKKKSDSGTHFEPQARLKNMVNFVYSFIRKNGFFHRQIRKY